MSISRPWRGPNGSRHIGRTRISAAKLLTEFLGTPVSPEDFVIVTGAWRTNKRLDVYRWEVFVTVGNNCVATIGCWSPMSQFVKRAKQGHLIQLSGNYGQDVAAVNFRRADTIDC